MSHNANVSFTTREFDAQVFQSLRYDFYDVGVLLQWVVYTIRPVRTKTVVAVKLSKITLLSVGILDKFPYRIDASDAANRNYLFGRRLHRQRDSMFIYTMS